MDTFSKLAAMSALLSTAATLHAEQPVRTIFVDASAPAGGDGTSWDRSYRDLGDACARATQLGLDAMSLTSGMVINLQLAQGTYRPGADRAAALSAFDIGGRLSTPVSAVPLVSGLNLNILGGFAGRHAPDPDLRDPSAYVSVVTADINGDDRPGFVNRDDNAQTVLAIYSRGPSIIGVDGLTITGGHVRARAGAVQPVSGGLYVGPTNAAVSLRSCTFTENEGAQGGGVKTTFGSIADCSFVGNRADEGGGCFATSVPVIGTVFRDNHARRGGGLIADGDVYRCEFRANTADEDGGGVIRANVATFVGSPTRFSLFAGNVAGHDGGAVFASGPKAFDFTRCTLAENRAATGGAVSLPRGAMNGCILWGNRASVNGDQAAVTRDTLSLNLSQVEDTARAVSVAPGAAVVRTSVSAADPRFVDRAGGDGVVGAVADNNYRLAADSPCIDRMVGWSFAGRDLDGLHTDEPGPGATAAVPDAGCYEWRRACPADFDNSGGVPDMLDLGAFFDAFRNGLPSADVNRSGGTPDTDDITAFFNVWLAGGC